MQEGSQFGPYTLIKRIAFGGMAEIHLAKTTGLGGFEKLLALKVIHPKYSEDQEFIDMLIDEAKIAVQLSHVNVCQVFDLGRISNTYFIAIEFIDGKDLYQLLVKCSERDITIPLDILAFIGLELSAGLHYAHTKSDNYGSPLCLVHRDVSPQNVLISYDAEVKIVDFGIAKAAKRSRETESGVIKGKFFYMSPEQAWGDPIDARTDVFSSGICLYEMLVGEMLYHEEKALLLLDKVRKAEIPSIREKRPEVPQALEQIVLRALSRDRDRRYQSSGELHAALSGFLYGNWPNFNRSRLVEFMRHVFGDQRFVLPRPPANGSKPNVRGSMLGNNGFASGHSVIFDLNQVDDLPKLQKGPSAMPRPSPVVEARFDEPEPTKALSEDQTGRVDDDDDYDERTIMESVWAPEPVRSAGPAAEDEDTTSLTGEDLEKVSKLSMPVHVEQPTSMYARPGESPPKRLNRPVSPPPADDLERTMALDPVDLEPTPAAQPRAVPRPIPTSPPKTPAPPPRPTAQGLRAPPPPPPPLADPATRGGPQKSPTLKPEGIKPTKPTVNRAAVSSARKGDSKLRKLGARLMSPGGLTAFVLVALLGYAAFQLLPTLLAPQKLRVAALVITSTPAGAKVHVNGVDTGQETPARVDNVAVGASHTVKLTLGGFDELTESVTIPASDLPPDGEVKRRLFLVKQRGRIEVGSTPDKADVFVDGKFSCETPCTVADVDREKNEVRLLLRKDGYRDYPEVIRWGEETHIKVDWKLAPRER